MMDIYTKRFRPDGNGLARCDRKAGSYFKTQLGVVWIVYDPRWTPSFNTLTGLLIIVDPKN